MHIWQKEIIFLNLFLSWCSTYLFYLNDFYNWVLSNSNFQIELKNVAGESTKRPRFSEIDTFTYINSKERFSVYVNYLILDIRLLHTITDVIKIHHP